MSLRHYFRRPPAVTAVEAVRLVADGALVVDVRRAFEWNRVHIPGAVHMPLEVLPERCLELPTSASSSPSAPAVSAPPVRRTC
ncbi:rhodanese-like domain-containing protein [Streptomyces malaysiensis]|uniref:rhodanese-like domain-containing protein n=1 Tax=Streptomyces malaysiensis TaxID=92644 RepID=UPI00340A8418